MMSKKAKKNRYCIDSTESDNISGKYFNETCKGLHANDKQFDDVPDYMYLGSNSGIPLAVETPAPPKNTILLLSLMISLNWFTFSS